MSFVSTNLILLASLPSRTSRQTINRLLSIFTCPSSRIEKVLCRPTWQNAATSVIQNDRFFPGETGPRTGFYCPPRSKIHRHNCISHRYSLSLPAEDNKNGQNKIHPRSRYPPAA